MKKTLILLTIITVLVGLELSLHSSVSAAVSSESSVAQAAVTKAAAPTATNHVWRLDRNSGWPVRLNKNGLLVSTLTPKKKGDCHVIQGLETF